VRRRPDGFQLPDCAAMAALAGSAEREVVGIVFCQGQVDVHAGRYQCRHELRAPGRGIRRERRAEREPGDQCLAAEPVVEEFQYRHRVVDHPGHADVELVRVLAQRS
jgi:hypothetical protein